MVVYSFQVSAIALSRSGRYLATGQVTYMGFTADIIIWDLENRQLMHRMGLHKVGLVPNPHALHGFRPQRLHPACSHPSCLCRSKSRP